ncbi:hypothetical protein [Micromonospora echinofusca]|uniref:hypothetical protein n=1 Tax=Micromonospora echinofusca TaxID=47858 RepID=UPI0033EAACD2
MPLDEDLLRRTYRTTDWRYPGPLLRRILPPVTRRLAAGEVDQQHTLVDPGAKVPAHEALAFVAEVTGQLAPWLNTWAQLLAGPTARRMLAAAADEWMSDLLGDRLPWSSWRDEEDTPCLALSMWVLRHAPPVLRDHDASGELHDLVRLLALPHADRWGERG